MSWLCKLGFHSAVPGYENQYKDMNVCFDGINRAHLTVAQQCVHCDEYYDYKHICLNGSTVNHINKYTPWINIRHAPKDGTKIRLWNGREHIGRWREADKYGEADWQLDKGLAFSFMNEKQPTHFMFIADSPNYMKPKIGE